jgi:acetate kinase
LQEALKKTLSGQVSQLLSDTPKFILKNETGNTVIERTFKNELKDNSYQVAVELIMQEIANYDKTLSIISTAHRIVHGDDEFKESTLITEAKLKQLEKYIPLAALHQPYNLKIASFFYNTYQSLNHYACFDTAFHQTMDPIGRVYAIPIHYAYEGIKKYGFHGLSYQYIASKLADYVGDETANKRCVIAHLGSGSSLCGIFNKKSITTTMGFSVLDGLPMATRCGTIDPAIITYLEKRDNLSPESINNILYNNSGLLGLSGGISGDIKTLSTTGSPEANFAIDVFCYQVILNIGKTVAALGGCDGIIFTAGVGENSYKIREAICEKLAWLQVKINPIRNRENEVHINAENSIPILVIPTNEEYIMAISALKDLD